MKLYKYLDLKQSERFLKYNIVNLTPVIYHRDLPFYFSRIVLKSKQKIMQTLNKYYLITSFSETYDNDLMWTRYGEFSKGLCIEINLNRHKSNMRIKKVEYLKKREVKDYIKNTWNIDRLDHLDDLLLLKDNEFAFEQEVRLIAKTENHSSKEGKRQFYNFLDGEVSKIHLGRKCSVSSKSIKFYEDSFPTVSIVN